MNIYIMCGIVGSGKSTEAKRIAKEKNGIIISKDNIRMAVHGSYIFDSHTEPLVKEIFDDILFYHIDRIIYCNSSYRCIILDETFITKEKRVKLIKELKKYKDTNFNPLNVICVYCSSIEGNLERRMKDSRGIQEEKWKDVIYMMKNAFEKPELSEGFDEIIEVKI